MSWPGPRRLGGRTGLARADACAARGVERRGRRSRRRAATACPRTRRCWARSIARSARAAPSSAPPAECPANCTSSGAARDPGRLPRRVRLLLHGLRDRGRPRREDGAARRATVAVLVGDGSYLMMNSELATSVAGGHPLLVVLCDNRGFGCIHRLQRATARRARTTTCRGSFRRAEAPVDFVAHARALGADAEKVGRTSPRSRRPSRSARGAARTTVHRDRDRPADRAPPRAAPGGTCRSRRCRRTRRVRDARARLAPRRSTKGKD